MILIILVFSPLVSADTGIPAKNTKFYSQNKQFYVEIEPNKNYGKQNIDVYKGPKATFFHSNKKSDNYTKTHEFDLINDYMPCSALLSDDGKYFVSEDIITQCPRSISSIQWSDDVRFEYYDTYNNQFGQDLALTIFIKYNCATVARDSILWAEVPYMFIENCDYKKVLFDIKTGTVILKAE